MDTPDTALRAWAASGAMALTGRRGGPPLAAPGTTASAVAVALADTARLTSRRTGQHPRLPGVEVLGERAAILGLTRNGPESCGGAFRTIRTLDGWLGLSLPRPDDIALVPALTENQVRQHDPWNVVAAWAATTSTTAAVERVELLGLAGGAVPTQPIPARRGVITTELGDKRFQRERPRVVDLSSLWAGPLCAHLLGLGGAEVIKIESTGRPDGTRSGPPGFFDLLHAGHAMVAVDFRDVDDVAHLRTLIADADLVLEASRPRALRQLGIDAQECVAAGTSWLSITARGRGSNAIGFGDDVAALAGLVVADGDTLLPCGDALADPLSGVWAAAAASAALISDRAQLIDVSMLHVAAENATAPTEPHTVSLLGDRWWVESEGGTFPVADPVARAAAHSAGPVGADNTAYLGPPR